MSSRWLLGWHRWLPRLVQRCVRAAGYLSSTPALPASAGTCWVVREPIKQRLRKEADIVRRREHTGMPGYSAHAARRRVKHNAPQQEIKIGILARIVLPSSSRVVGAMRDKTRCSTSAQERLGPPRSIGAGAQATADPRITTDTRRPGGRYRVSVMPVAQRHSAKRTLLLAVSH